MAIAERVLRAHVRRGPRGPPTWVIAGDGVHHGGRQPRGRVARRVPRALATSPSSTTTTTSRSTDRPSSRSTTTRRRVSLPTAGRCSTSARPRTTPTPSRTPCAAAIAEESRPTLIVLRSHIGYPSPQMMDRARGPRDPVQRRGDQRGQGHPRRARRAFLLDPSLPAQLVDTLERGREARGRLAGTAGRRPAQRGRSLRTTAAHPRRDRGARRARAVRARRARSRRARPSSARWTPWRPRHPGSRRGRRTSPTTPASSSGRDGPGTPDTPSGRQIHYGIREFAMARHHGGPGPSRGDPAGGLDLLRLQRLHAPGASPRGPERGPGALRLHPRLGRRRRGRADPRAGRAPHGAARDARASTSCARRTRTRRSTWSSALLADPQPAPTALVLSRQDVAVLDGEDAPPARAGASTRRVRRARGRRRALHPRGHRLRGRALPERQRDPSRRAASPRASSRCRAGGALTPRTRRVPRRGAAAATCLGRRSRPARRWAGSATWTRRIGIDDFGMSAPGPVVFEHFRIDAQAARRPTSKRVLGSARDDTRRPSTSDYGQSPWIDNIRRDWLNDGTLARLVGDGVRGVTSEPVDLRQGAVDVVGLRRRGGRARATWSPRRSSSCSPSRTSRDACDVLSGVHEASVADSPPGDAATATASSPSRSRRDWRATPTPRSPRRGDSRARSAGRT